MALDKNHPKFLPPVQNTLKDYLPPKESRGLKERIILLLGERHTTERISQLVGATKWQIYKVATRAEAKGILIKENKNPVLYTKGINYEEYRKFAFGQPFSSTKKKSKPIQLLTPHRFPVYYHIGSPAYQLGLNLPIIYRKTWKGKKDIKDNLTAIWGTKTLTIWVKTFKRITPKEEIEEGIKTAISYAQLHPNGKLRFSNLGKRIEWVFENKPLSDIIRSKLGLKLNEPLFIAKAKFIIDTTHPENVEVNKAPNESEARPTEIAKLADILFSPEKFWADYQQKSELIRQQNELNATLQDGQKLLLKRIEELEAKDKR